MSNSIQVKTNTMSKQNERDATTAFPAMVHRMLSDLDELARKDPEMRSLRDVVSWQEHGRAFKVHNKKKFVTVVMPTWFPRIKYSSWVRQLSLFGFQKIHRDGEDKGAMYHENFIRGMPELARSILKLKRKSQQSQQDIQHLMILPPKVIESPDNCGEQAVPRETAQDSLKALLHPSKVPRHLYIGELQGHSDSWQKSYMFPDALEPLDMSVVWKPDGIGSCSDNQTCDKDLFKSLLKTLDHDNTHDLSWPSWSSSAQQVIKNSQEAHSWEDSSYMEDLEPLPLPTELSVGEFARAATFTGTRGQYGHGVPL